MNARLLHPHAGGDRRGHDSPCREETRRSYAGVVDEPPAQRSDVPLRLGNGRPRTAREYRRRSLRVPPTWRPIGCVAQRAVPKLFWIFVIRCSDRAVRGDKNRSIRRMRSCFRKVAAFYLYEVAKPTANEPGRVIVVTAPESQVTDQVPSERGLARELVSGMTRWRMATRRNVAHECKHSAAARPGPRTELVSGPRDRRWQAASDEVSTV